MAAFLGAKAIGPKSIAPSPVALAENAVRPDLILMGLEEFAPFVAGFPGIGSDV